MLLRVFVLTAALSIVGPSGGMATTAVAITGATAGEAAPPNDTINEFFPEDRSLGDCLSSLPKPGCGSEARGGWRQTLVLIAILAGLTFIAWRIVAQSRKAGR